MTVEEKIFPQDEPEPLPDEPDKLKTAPDEPAAALPDPSEMPPSEPETAPDEAETLPDEPEALPPVESEALSDEGEPLPDTDAPAAVQARSWRYFIAGMGLALLAVALGAVLGYLARPALEPAIPSTTGALTPAESGASVAATPVVAAPTTQAPANVVDIVQAGGHSQGSPDAPVVIVEYSDFQCPYCGRHFREVEGRLKEAYVQNNQVRLVYKHYTILGQESVWAALASECAAAFGQNKFWEYHNLVFSRQNGENQGAFNPDNLKAWAGELGLDTATFNQCFDSQKYLDVVQANTAEAQQLGIRGTPGFFVNGASVAGAQPFEVFQQVIEAELAKIQSSGDGATPATNNSASTGADAAMPTAAGASAAATPPPTEEQWDVQIAQMRGLGFSADGRQLVVATNEGFRIFADGTWSVPDLPKHDYLGYEVTDDGFYSSGYPDPTANMVSPLGLVKSTDGGKTLTKLAFEGESDFNLVGVGYRNHAIYVFNGVPNSKLTLGIHYSLDDGQTWQESALRGLKNSPARIAVHPTEANRVAIATEGGLLLSSDYGDTFEPVGESGPAIAAAFDPGGALLFFGYQQLSAYELANKKILPLTTPTVSEQDAIAYIAVSPTKLEEMAFATFLGDLHFSQDGGQTWQQLLQAGKGKSVQ